MEPKDEVLPQLNEDQEWCCWKGCGPCTPVQTDFVYSSTTDLVGNLLESKSFKVWVSHCCKANLALWDEGLNDFIEWTPVEQA